MATVHDFVEEWIEIRAKLQRQLKPLDSGRTDAGGAVMESATATAASIRIKKCIEELNALLKEHAAADHVKS